MDDSFPPAPKSLYYNPAETKDNHVVQWLRPHQIVMEEDCSLNWVVFRTPKPSDISQGNYNFSNVNTLKRQILLM